MKYINAAEVLPKQLLIEIQKYITGQMIYVPNGSAQQKGWGEKNGTKSFFEMRNKQIKEAYQGGKSIEELSETFGLAYETIRKIVYKKQKEES